MPWVHDHLRDLDAALAREHAWQVRELARLLALDHADRVDVGVSWPLTRVEDLQWRSRGGADLVLRALTGSVLHDAIGPGDRVRVCPEGSPGTGPVATVLAVDERAVEVRAWGELPEVGCVVEVVQTVNDRVVERWREVLAEADAAPSRVAQVLLGARPPSPPSQHGPRFPELDPSQEAAARAALAAGEVALIHGPPGTGKTTALVGVLRALVEGGDRPWALADSNAAVDHLAERAAAAGLRVVRVGHPSRVGSAASGLTVDARVEAGPLGQALRSLERELGRARSSGASVGELVREHRALLHRARADVLAGAEVLALTLGTLAVRGTSELPVPHTAVVDEATQAVEPALWPVAQAVQRLILAGDPHQLGPVVKAPGNPLERSLLQRLLDEGVLPLPMLTTQRRMHRSIQALVDPVYGGRLRAHPSVAAASLAELGIGALDGAALWVDTAGAGMDEERDARSQSRANPGEAALVAYAARLLLDAGLDPAAMGVIAPYSAQVALLRDALPDVEVATVNAFQGRERTAILCSFVRSNADGEVGFVADPRRLTVALTRARRLLLCVGDSATLSGVPGFARVIDTLQADGGYRSVWDEPWAGVWRPPT